MTIASPLKIVVVGGVAGGASAAARARRMNADAEITIFEKGPAISFANCGLPYHIGGEIPERAKLLVATQELFRKRFRIETKIHHEVTAIDRSRKVIRVVDLSNQQTLEVPYDRLILATGSVPNTPAFLQSKPSNVLHLWTLPDMDNVMQELKTHSVRSAVVVGAGFVGLEVVEQLVRRGIRVTLVERNPQVLTRLDRDLARIVERHLKAKGVDVHLNASVQSLAIDQERAVAAILNDGIRLETDLVIVGAGVRPRIELARDAGLELGAAGGVSVNAFMQTSDPAIYAVGDIVEYEHGVTGQRTLNPLAGPANRSGRIAGTHAATGSAEPMAPVLGTSIVRVFDVTAATTGLNERALISKGIPFRSAIIQAPHHASYFPGAMSMQLKLLYAPNTGRVLGAQGVGGDGVDKRIDVVATAMHFQGTVEHLAQLDLAYAPPFGSAKDPLHMAAFVACNDLKSAPRLVPPNADLNGKQIVDVRNESECKQLPLQGAVHIPVDQMIDRWSELDANRETVVVCHSGKRAHVAACWLKGKGFTDIANLSGGMVIRSLIDADGSASVSS